ncbi:MAG: DNA polymerase III subunit gamma/tau [Coriobacteriales bacterium]|jgi:DNA polymerase-3 subunit gamma/tau|nr:DNA polymerase III subunit gamma/tau [Coriobacteriales bacterium]
MALSLYRKYRPETFSDVVGQEHVEQTLMNAVANGTVTHAYLFCGPRGTGKTTTARLLAKALLCDKAPTADPDGTCEACQQIAAGAHPDVYELDAASRTGVDNVRDEIISRVQFAPTRGAYKIYIIDEVHMLSVAAFNALLKTLEEPPAHVVFILCTTDPHKVPQTVASRCQRFDFHRLSATQIAGRLKSICDGEGFTANERALDLIAERSQGGMRDAITSLEQVAVFGGGDVTYEAAESMLGEVEVDQMFELADLIAKRDVAGCFEWVASFSNSGTDIALFVNDFATHIRDIYVCAIAKPGADLSDALEIDASLLSRYGEQAAAFGGVDRIAYVLTILGDLSSELKSATNARLALEIALTRMVRPSSDLTLESLAARVATLESAGPVTVATDSRTTTAGSGTPAVGSDMVAGTDKVAGEAAGASAATGVNAATGATGAAETAKAGTAAGASAAPAPQRQEPGAPGNISADDLGKDENNNANGGATETLSDMSVARIWIEATTAAKKKKRSIGSMFGGSRPSYDANSNTISVELPSEATFSKSTLDRPENLELVKRAIETICGQYPVLVYTLASNHNAATTPGPEAVPVPAPEPIPATEPGPASAPAAAPESEPTPTTAQTPEQDASNDAESILKSTFGDNITFEEV